MTPRRRNALGILASIVCGLLVLSLRSCSAGEGKRLRRETQSQLRLIKARGRAAAGYPFLQTTANVSRVAANISGLFNPIGWFL